MSRERMKGYFSRKRVESFSRDLQSGKKGIGLRPYVVVKDDNGDLLVCTEVCRKDVESTSKWDDLVCVGEFWSDQYVLHGLMKLDEFNPAYEEINRLRLPIY